MQAQAWQKTARQARRGDVVIGDVTTSKARQAWYGQVKHGKARQGR